MRMPIRSVLVAGAVAALAFPATAAARPGDQTFAQTFPRANALCLANAAGHTPARYAGLEASVEQACLDLQDAFTRADAAMDAANATFDAGMSAADTARDQACQRPRRPVACAVAQAQFRVTAARLRATHRAAVLAYLNAVGSARDAFWVTASTPSEPQPT